MLTLLLLLNVYLQENIKYLLSVDFPISNAGYLLQKNAAKKCCKKVLLVAKKVIMTAALLLENDNTFLTLFKNYLQDTCIFKN